jgi:YggT family protein
VLYFAILARVLISWLPISRESPLVQLLYSITEPVLGPIRRILPSMGGLDLSPMFAMILIWVAQRVLLTMIGRLA